jgi:acyl-CoA synthetase (AMP-forming)/AMP-acid ligase II
VQHCYRVDEGDEVHGELHERAGEHELYRVLRERGSPGLVLFSSGSSGRPKAAVHDFSKLLAKFQTRRHALKTVNFLLFDHWGGLNTMFHTLSNGGTVYTVARRQPDEICAAIERYRIELLPASPSFLSLLLMSEAHRRFDLSSLKVISYGTEPMPESTLRRMKEAYPDVKLQQTYGLIELGVLRSKSRSSDSLWIKIGGEGFEWRVVDGMLEILADSAMLGYLNAPSPFTADGWFMTGDAVEVDGEWLWILGRKSELINVGGEKVYPAEVESVIQELPNVAQATVYGEANAILGNIVCVRVRLAEPEDPKEFARRLKAHCAERLAGYKVPVRVSVRDDEQMSGRLKKVRYREG